MTDPSPREQGTVSETKSSYAWIVYLVIALLAIAWYLQPFLVAEKPIATPPALAPTATTDLPPQAWQSDVAVPEASPLPPQGLEAAPEDALPPVTDSCDQAIAGLNLPPDFQVLATGAYGGRNLGFQIDQSGHEATQIDVVVRGADKPVALMLGAYEPTVWNVSWTKGTRIVAVYVGGYHAQRVAGLPREMPLINSSYEEKGNCPYFYISSDGMEKVNPAARRVFNRPVDMVYPAGRDGTAFVGSSGSLGSIQNSPDSTIASFRDAHAPLAGQPGIEEAIRLGQLRRAGPGDSGLWAQAQSQRGHDLPPIAGLAPQSPPPPGNLYIVQGEFTYPAGLYGAHAVMFLVPPGVPQPKGNPGHSSVFVLR